MHKGPVVGWLLHQGAFNRPNITFISITDAKRVLGETEENQDTTVGPPPVHSLDVLSNLLKTTSLRHSGVPQWSDTVLHTRANETLYSI